MAKGLTQYLKVLKDQRGYRVDGFTSVFKTYNELKNYFERTASTQVKFIKMF
jgi:hypothetical protein